MRCRGGNDRTRCVSRVGADTTVAVAKTSDSTGDIGPVESATDYGGYMGWSAAAYTTQDSDSKWDGGMEKEPHGEGQDVLVWSNYLKSVNRLPQSKKKKQRDQSHEAIHQG